MKLLKYIIFSGSYMLFAIAGFLYHIKWCENIVTFFTWLFFAIIFSYTFMNETIRKEIVNNVRKQGRSVNKYVDYTFDILMLGILAASASYLFVLYAYNCLVNEGIHQQAEKEII